MSDLPPEPDGYRARLAAEASVWGAEAERQADAGPPDWQLLRNQREHRITHAREIDDLLARVHPGMKVLEVGCFSGWLTLEMARRGADATGIDVSDRALEVARRYSRSPRHEIAGSATYVAADLNRAQLPSQIYDLAVAKGILHHLVEVEHLLEQLLRCLKPGGLLWVSDTSGDERASTVLLAGALALLLPTRTPYREKMSALLRFGLRSPGRVRASMQAEGLSPFEGAGRRTDWVRLIRERFEVVSLAHAPAVTGYLAAQLEAPERVAVPLLRALRALDRAAVRARLLRGTSVVVLARKPGSHPS